MAKLRVWHIPQAPMQPFYVDVESVDEAIKALNILSDYDRFQYENHVKPDYCNMQGLEKWCEEDQEWYEWENKDGLDIREVMRDRLNDCDGVSK